MKYPGKVKAPKPAPAPVDPRNNEWEMHPDDRKMRKEAVAFAKNNGALFLDAAKADLGRLVTIYSDAEAHAALDSLREKFWGGGWCSVPERTAPTSSEGGR